MRLWCILLALSRALACNYHFGNLAYLNPTQLKLYNLKNCTVTCKTCFHGTFCQAMPSALTAGPWKDAGLYTVGAGAVRVLSSISGSINGFFPAFYNGSSSTVGLKSSGAALVLAETSFGGQTPTTILEPPALGTLDSLVVRNGIIYVSQSLSPARQSTLLASLTTVE